MQRINNNEIQFTADEVQIKAKYDELLDRGYNIPDAVAAVKEDPYSQIAMLTEGNVTDSFWEYLSE